MDIGRCNKLRARKEMYIYIYIVQHNIEQCSGPCILKLRWSYRSSSSVTPFVIVHNSIHDTECYYYQKSLLLFVIIVTICFYLCDYVDHVQISMYQTHVSFKTSHVILMFAVTLPYLS